MGGVACFEGGVEVGRCREWDSHVCVYTPKRLCSQVASKLWTLCDAPSGDVECVYVRHMKRLNRTQAVDNLRLP